MSRAFTKEPDGEQAEAELPARPQSKHPNYITKIGLEKQKEDLLILQKAAHLHVLFVLINLGLEREEVEKLKKY